MENKVLIVTCSHGLLAEEIIRSAEMIIGPMEDAVSCCLSPGMDPKDFYELVEEKFRAFPSYSILALADLFGGTPCNTMARFLSAKKMHLVTGLNLGMLIEVYTKRKEMSITELKDLAINTLVSSCVDVNEKLGISN